MPDGGENVAHNYPGSAETPSSYRINQNTDVTASNFLSIRVLTRHIQPRSALSYLLNQTKMMCIWVINGNEGILKTVINQRDSCGVTLMKKASVS